MKYNQLSKAKHETSYKITHPDTDGRVVDGLNVRTNGDGLWHVVRSDGADTVAPAADLTPDFLVIEACCALAAAAFLCRKTAEYICFEWAM
jgi:hypothetical protein